MRIIIINIFLQAAIICAAVNITGPIQTALNNLKNGEIELAIQQIKHQAATNDLIAQYYLAQCHEYGIGMPIDKNQAFAMYRRAAERGLPEAMADLSRCYYDGVGVYPNPDKSNIWNQRYRNRNTGENIPSLISYYNETLLPLNDNAKNSHETDLGSSINPNNSNKTKDSIPNQNKVTSSPKQCEASERKHTAEVVPIPNKEKHKSDIDINLPFTKISNESVFAIIFANENYQDVASVPNAINDGESMAKYCNVTLGIPHTNIHLVKNATLNNIRRELNLMKQIAAAYKNEASFIIYYAGHGIPDEDTHNAFLFPVDGFPGDMTTCFSLNELYESLGKMDVKRNIVIFDACFSGASRNTEMLVSARGIVIAPKENKPSGKTFVLASSQGNETSYSYDDMQHGLFTYYLLKKIKESKGDVTLGSLVDYIKENVSKKSIVINGKSQNPCVSISPDIAKEWRTWTLR